MEKGQTFFMTLVAMKCLHRNRMRNLVISPQFIKIMLGNNQIREIVSV